MGIKSCVTCSMSFGENGECVGYLLGKEREGMKIMFHMMNEFRMGLQFRPKVYPLQHISMLLLMLRQDCRAMP
jgi:hypothetical protein